MNKDTRKFVGRFAIYGIGSIAQSAAGFLLIPLFTESYSATEYGLYTIIWLIGNIFSSFLYLGVASALPKFFYVHGDHKERKEVFSSGYAIVVLGMMLQVLIGFIFSSLISDIFFDKADYKLHIMLSLIGGGLGFLNYYLISFLRVLDKPFSFIVFNLSLVTLTLILTYYLISIQKDQLLSPFLAVALANFLYVLLLSFYFIQQKWLTFSFDTQLIKKMLFFGVPLAFSSVASMGVDWSDRFILEYFSGFDSVGVYSLSYKIAGLVNIILITPFVQLWGPLMMQKKDQPDTLLFFHTIFKAYACAAFFILIFIICFYETLSPYVIRSSSYGNTFNLVIMITAGLLIYGLGNILYCGLLYANKTKVVMWINYCGALLNISLCVALVPWYGAYGAAISTLISYIVIPLTMHYFSNRYFSFAPFKENFYTLAFSLLIISILLVGNFYHSHFSIPIKILIFITTTAFIGFLFFYETINKLNIRRILKVQ